MKDILKFFALFFGATFIVRWFLGASPEIGGIGFILLCIFGLYLEGDE